MIRYLGKLAPKTDPLTDQTLVKFSAAHAIPADLPRASAARNWADNVPRDMDPLGNTQKGCCVLSAIGHYITMQYAQHGLRSPVTEAAVLALYDELTGGNDVGLYLRDTLEYVAENGLCGVKIARPVAIDWNDRELMAIASGLFGGLIVGAALPTEAQEQEIWDVTGWTTPGSWGRHAMFREGHSPGLGNHRTWGYAQDATAAWETRCLDEAYATYVRDLPPPSGLNLEALERSFALL